MAAEGVEQRSDFFPWVAVDDDEPQLILYFFWSQNCPHCQRALPEVQELEVRFDWLRVRSFEISRDRQNARRYMQIASQLGERARSVPGFVFCKTMLVGFDNDGYMADALETELERCHTHLHAYGNLTGFSPSWELEDAGGTVVLPGMESVATRDLSLPWLTIMIAGLDAFNPCAFFVLLFLLSLLVHGASRTRMVAIGSTFVVMSGVLYFLFMTAWLNIFLLAGQLAFITVIAGFLAVFMGLINIKDFFWFGQGLSLSIPGRAKPELFRRMRALLETGSLPALLAGTVGLSLFANMYEFLCTSGFPMVYTRLLTLNDVSLGGYYFYLALYNIVYVVPLAIIVAAFAITLGRRKLSAGEGRFLKLLSGLMMFELGVVLIIAPNLMNRLWIAAGLLGSAVTGALILRALERWASIRYTNRGG